MTTQVIPQLKDVFLDSGAELPNSTKFLLALSDFMLSRWYVVLVGVVLALLGLKVFLRTDIGHRVYSRYSLKAPVAGSIIEESSMGRFSRLMGMLLGSGVPLLEALRLIGDSFTNQLHKEALAQVSVDVERGVPMSGSIANNPIFPAMVAQMVAVGEQTGKMDEIMIRMADYYDEEVEAKVASIASLIEPLIIVLLGIGVAWLVQAVLLPIYQASTNV